jgi:Ca-activated chloride channel family protein
MKKIEKRKVPLISNIKSAPIFLLLFIFLGVNTGLLHAQSNGTKLKVSGKVTAQSDGSPLPGVNVAVKGSYKTTSTDQAGAYSISVPAPNDSLVFTFIGYQKQTIAVKGRSTINVALKQSDQESDEVVEQKITLDSELALDQPLMNKGYAGIQQNRSYAIPQPPSFPNFNTEEYDEIEENEYRTVANHPLSTFSIDVDAASYSNVRRMINEGNMPDKGAVRIEEMINYFNYDYPDPDNDHPFSINLESGPSPWNEKHELVHIGIQGERIAQQDLPPSNLVFLMDVSGSMQSRNKLPLLKKAFRLLVDQLQPEDRVAIVVYAGSSGLVLPSTPAAEKDSILSSISELRAGGSTAGAEGIKLAYEVAAENFMEDANNRVILATDGDFNVGTSSDSELVNLIKEKRDKGIFLSVLGFGSGNYKGSKMEKIADNGNGNYSYIDNILEAKKVLVSEIGSTLLTIAKDVKIQVEFNPAQVQAYRLIGYENRLLNKEDFNDDTKDAGELGAGHSVTALYEIVPAGVKPDSAFSSVDSLKYQKVQSEPDNSYSDELLTVKLRYKKPDGDNSILLSEVITENNFEEKLSPNLMFSSAVAGFGMLLRDSQFKGSATYDTIMDMAKESKGADENGYRAEFLRLVEASQLLDSDQLSDGKSTR